MRVVSIAAYQSGWRDEFLELGGELRRALGTRALRIDHVGSTAVPGLAAKDVIDIQVTVAALQPELLPIIARAGYEHRAHADRDHIPAGGSQAEDDWSKWFFRRRETRWVNLHVRVMGRPNQRYALLFRDYLRAHPNAAEAYARLKRALAARHPEDIESYIATKDPVCDLIFQAAGSWADSVNWSPAPSDT